MEHAISIMAMLMVLNAPPYQMKPKWHLDCEAEFKRSDLARAPPYSIAHV
jgi:hypothetical protein